MESDNSLEDQDLESDPVMATADYIPQTGEVRDDDNFRILVASDIHLGFCDNNPAREPDSFNTFEEILQLANDKEVDFLLLGGDLFHENKPRPHILRQTTDLLRKYCLGDRPVAFQYVGIPENDFPNQADPGVNYYDSNINIALPVFTIHGNHDDPIGATKTSAVDHLAAAKLLNHFGTWDNLNSITIAPVLLVKGETKIALYGLGHLKDDRLHRLMQDRKVLFVGPEEDANSWFNLFVLHQNRVKHGHKNYVPEDFIPGYIQLAIWGHEHECRLKKTHNGVEGAEGLPKTYICQPGSSVATSLGAGEMEEKNVALLQICGRKFRVEPVKLQTVRPFVTKDVMAKDVLDKLPKNATVKERTRHLEKYVEKVVDEMIENSYDQLTGHPKQPTLPLIRVRVFHDDIDDSFNPMRFSQKFADKVANEDIVLFKRTPIKREDGAEIDADEIEQLIMDQDDDDLDGHVETIVETYFANARANNKQNELLEVLSEKGISEAVKCAVEKDDDKAIQLVIESQMDKAIQYLIRKKVTEETVADVVDEFREMRAALAEEEKKEVEGILRNIKPKIRANGSVGDDDDDGTNGHNGEAEEEESLEDSIIDDDDDEVVALGARGGKGSRARGRGRGSNASTSRGRGSRSTRAASRDESMSPPPTPSRGRGSRGGRGARGRGAGSKETTRGGKTLVQTTLPVRRQSPRKASQGGRMLFDDDSD